MQEEAQATSGAPNLRPIALETIGADNPVTALGTPIAVATTQLHWIWRLAALRATPALHKNRDRVSFEYRPCPPSR
jgi:hypothetical protein